MSDQKGPFMEWVARATQIAARAVKVLNVRNALIEQVRGLRAVGKHDETRELQPRFDENREQNRAILGEAETFRREFAEKFPDRGDQQQFVAGVRRQAIANLFTFRLGKGRDAEMINVASQVMWVVAPWDRGTFAILRLRDRTGLNVTEVNPDTLKRLIKATEAMLSKLADNLPSIDDIADGASDFATAQVVEEYDEVNADLGQVHSVLERIEASRKRGKEQHQRGGGEIETEKKVEDPIARLAREIEEKKRVMQQAASGPKPNFARAAELQAEIETLAQKLEQMRTEKVEKDRMSGVAAMAGAAPETGVPIVNLSGLMVVVEETGEEKPVEEAIALYKKQLEEMNEAAAEHDAEAAKVEAEGDQIILNGGNKAEAGKKYLSAETSRAAALQCRGNVEKLNAMLADMQSDLTQHAADQAVAAKQKVKDAAPAVVEAPVEETTPVAEVLDKPPTAAELKQFVEDASAVKVKPPAEVTGEVKEPGGEGAVVNAEAQIARLEGVLKAAIKAKNRELISPLTSLLQSAKDFSKNKGEDEGVLGMLADAVVDAEGGDGKLIRDTAEALSALAQ